MSSATFLNVKFLGLSERTTVGPLLCERGRMSARYCQHKRKQEHFWKSQPKKHFFRNTVVSLCVNTIMCWISLLSQFFQKPHLLLECSFTIIYRKVFCDGRISGHTHSPCLPSLCKRNPNIVLQYFNETAASFLQPL